MREDYFQQQKNHAHNTKILLDVATVHVKKFVMEIQRLKFATILAPSNASASLDTSEFQVANASAKPYCYPLLKYISVS